MRNRRAYIVSALFAFARQKVRTAQVAYSRQHLSFAKHCCTYLHGGYPDRRPNTGKDNVAWYLADDITDGPACLHVVQLISI
jgi:hypothetical protein